MAKDLLSVAETLMLNRFQFCGTVRAEDRKISEQLVVPLPKGSAIYAFRQFGEWLYIGSAASGARSRLSSYVRRQRSLCKKQKHSDLRQCLAKGPIEFWVLPIEDRVRIIDDFPVDWLLGVEAGLIKTLHPRINRRERVQEYPKATGSL